MSIPTFIFYFCSGLYGVMMSICGYTVASWPFWVGLTLIITSHICGREIGDRRYKA